MFSFLKSLQWRLVIIFILLNTSLMIFVGVVLNKRVESSYYDVFSKQVEKNFDNWQLLKQEPEPSIDSILYSLKDQNEKVYNFLVTDFKTCTVIDRKKAEIVYSTDSRFMQNNSTIMLEMLKSPNLMLAMEDKKGNRNTLMHSNSIGVYFDYARPVGDDAILYFIYDSEEWKPIINSFKAIILSCSLMAVVLSFILGYALSKTITVPIARIMNKARKIAAGDFDQVLEVKSDDEIGELTQTFNYMEKELKNTLNEMSSEKSKIETILKNMTDGLIAFNLKGEVVHVNATALKMLDLKEFTGSFNEFTRKYELETTLEEVTYLGATVNNEKLIMLNDKFIKINFALYTDEDNNAEGIVAVLQDNTEQQKLDNMRKDFVANVSHELRTPLTSIKSYSETLLDGVLDDRETAERFLGVIFSEADRMSRLVNDLLLLSRVDAQQSQWSSRSDVQKMKWKVENISFSDLVKGAVEKMRIEANNKQQTLECFVIGDIPYISADYDRIEQVMLNLLSNAIKYTPEGGKVTVYVGRMYSEVYAKVADNGIGIPEEDLPRVFERFYRVDKARSREMGGTGLGLSIAKEIVEAHNGTITAASEKDKGTEFIVKLPIDTDQLRV